MSDREENSAALSRVIVSLMKGVVYRDTDENLWKHVTVLQSAVRDRVAVMGLQLTVDEAEGFAWLSNRQTEEGDDTPRLVARRQLSFPVSLLLVLLRKKLMEHDNSGGDSRLILSRDEVVDLVRVFLPSGGNEARLVDQIDGHIARIAELGFIRRLKTQEHMIEVRRVIKAFVDAQWLSDFDERLREYKQHLFSPENDAEPEE